MKDKNWKEFIRGVASHTNLNVDKIIEDWDNYFTKYNILEEEEQNQEFDSTMRLNAEIKVFEKYER